MLICAQIRKRFCWYQATVVNRLGGHGGCLDYVTPLTHFSSYLITLSSLTCNAPNYTTLRRILAPAETGMRNVWLWPKKQPLPSCQWLKQDFHWFTLQGSARTTVGIPLFYRWSYCSTIIVAEANTVHTIIRNRGKTFCSLASLPNYFKFHTNLMPVTMYRENIRGNIAFHMLLMIHSKETDNYQRDRVSILDSQHSAGLKSSHHIILSSGSGLFWFTATAKGRLAVFSLSQLTSWSRGLVHAVGHASLVRQEALVQETLEAFCSCLVWPLRSHRPCSHAVNIA